MKESAYQHRVTVIVKVLLVLAAYHFSLLLPRKLMAIPRSDRLSLPATGISSPLST